MKSDTLILTSTATTSDYLEALNQLLGDSHFQKSGSTYTSTLEQDGVTILFHLCTSGSQVNGYGLEMTTADPEAQMTMTMEMKGDDMSLLLEMAGMTMEMDARNRASRRRHCGGPVGTAHHPCQRTLIPQLRNRSFFAKRPRRTAGSFRLKAQAHP